MYKNFSFLEKFLGFTLKRKLKNLKKVHINIYILYYINQIQIKMKYSNSTPQSSKYLSQVHLDLR